MLNTPLVFPMSVLLVSQSQDILSPSIAFIFFQSPVKPGCFLMVLDGRLRAGVRIPGHNFDGCNKVLCKMVRSLCTQQRERHLNRKVFCLINEFAILDIKFCKEFYEICICNDL